MNLITLKLRISFYQKAQLTACKYMGQGEKKVFTIDMFNNSHNTNIYHMWRIQKNYELISERQTTKQKNKQKTKIKDLVRYFMKEFKIFLKKSLKWAF